MSAAHTRPDPDPRSEAAARSDRDRAEWRRLRCSFCGKDGNHVRFLAAGVAGGMICDRCCGIAILIFVKARIARLFRPAAA